MMEMGLDQAVILARTKFIQKMDVAFAREIPRFAALEEKARLEFLVECLRSADALGLSTEQGVASYAMGAWWIEVGFENKSPLLRALLASPYPEFRKVHAMNEWVNGYLGAHGAITVADEKLKQALPVTEGWGTGSKP